MVCCSLVRTTVQLGVEFSSNRGWVLHSCLELGMFLRRSYFLTLTETFHNVCLQHQSELRTN